jgi:hypothetical protein
MNTADSTSSSLSSLDDVLITAELTHRLARLSDFEAESRALVALASDMAASPETILQKLVDTILELCRADSAGISILQPNDGPGVIRWQVT